MFSNVFQNSRWVGQQKLFFGQDKKLPFQMFSNLSYLAKAVQFQFRYYQIFTQSEFIIRNAQNGKIQNLMDFWKL